jgi:hypothetical protein
MRGIIKYIPILNSIAALGEYILDCIEAKRYRKLWRDLCELIVISLLISFVILYVIANAPSYKNNHINSLFCR